MARSGPWYTKRWRGHQARWRVAGVWHAGRCGAQELTSEGWRERGRQDKAGEGLTGAQTVMERWSDGGGRRWRKASRRMSAREREGAREWSEEAW